MTAAQKDRELSKGDRASLLAFLVAGFVIAASTVTYAALRILEIARGTDVPVDVDFMSTPVDVPLNDGSGTAQVAMTNGVLTVSELPPVGIGTGIIGQILLVLTIVTVIASLSLLARNFLLGRIFGRSSTVLVMTAGFTALFGFSAVRFFDNMLANAAVAFEADNLLDNAIITVEPFVFILGAFALATIGTAFTIGARLQQDTKGLV